MLPGIKAVAGTQAAAGARALASSPAWGTAEEVPGTAALNSGGNAQVTGVSCGSDGNCGVIGNYAVNHGSHPARPFVGSEANGTWRTVRQMPGTTALSPGGITISAVSCASAGNCSAGGSYLLPDNDIGVFVVSEVNGTWGTAEEVPGTSSLNSGRGAITSVSCASAGNCTAGGQDFDSSGYDAFLVSETNGTWGTAEEVPGLAALNQGLASITSVSCPTARNCTAGGYYYDSSDRSQSFVVSETNGTWGTAEEVPGTAALNQGGDASITSVSCTSAGNCSAGGSYGIAFNEQQAFVVSEVHGTWGTAEKVPGTAAFNASTLASITSLSCASTGNCSAGGYYSDSSGFEQAFVVNQVNGTWDTAEEVPGTAALNQGSGSTTTVTCPSAGNCSAGGNYNDGTAFQAFVVSETNGTWGTAEEVPGTAALNQGGNASLTSVSCASTGNCGAGGYYTDSSGHQQAFVVSQP
jgi:hypothetical protein